MTRSQITKKANILWIIKITRVKGNPTSQIVRSLLAFKRFEMPILEVDDIIIEMNRHEYTNEYIELTKDFYLKM